jgi:predicted aconitase
LLEGLASAICGQRRVRIPTITDPRGTDFANADLLGQTSAMLDLERRALAAFAQLGVAMRTTCISSENIWLRPGASMRPSAIQAW